MRMPTKVKKEKEVEANPELKPLFDEEPEGLRPLVKYIWDQLGSIADYKDYEKNLKYADDSEITYKKNNETEATIYAGQVNEDGKPHGFGRKYLRGAIYEGQFEDGERDGWGRLI